LGRPVSGLGGKQARAARITKHSERLGGARPISYLGRPVSGLGGKQARAARITKLIKCRDGLLTQRQAFVYCHSSQQL
jgi:hypothetical protein